MHGNKLELLTAQHDADVVGKLDHAGATPSDRFGHTLGDVGRYEGGHHAHTEPSKKSAEVEDAESDICRAAEAHDTLDQTTDQVDDTRGNERRLSPKGVGQVSGE